jgi:hypothetical protein
MLFILIPLAWLTVMTVIVAVCRMAAHADAAPGTLAETQPGSLRDGLVLAEDPTALALQTRRLLHDRRPLQDKRALQGRRPASRQRRIAAHGTR